jgi:hypothetical protein
MPTAKKSQKFSEIEDHNHQHHQQEVHAIKMTDKRPVTRNKKTICPCPFVEN